MKTLCLLTLLAVISSACAGSISLSAEFKNLTDKYTDQLLACRDIVDAFRKGRDFVGRLDYDADFEKRLQTSWSSRLACKFGDPPSTPSGSTSTLSERDLESLFAQEASKVTKDVVEKLMPEIELVGMAILDRLFKFTADGISGMNSNTEGYQPEKDGTFLLPIRDWHDLILIIAEYHPFMLPVVEKLCPWFRSVSTHIKSLWEFMELQTGLRRLTSMGIRLQVPSSMCTETMSYFFPALIPHSKRLMQLSAYFTTRPALKLQFRINLSLMPTSNLFDDSAWKNHLRRHDWQRMRNSDALFPFPSTPKTINDAMMIKLTIPTEGLVTEETTNTRALLESLKAAFENEMQLGNLIKRLAIDNTYYKTENDLYEETLKELFKRCKDPVKAEADGVPIDELTDTRAPYDPHSLIGILVSIPGHSISWILDLKRRHLYVANRGLHLVISGVVRYDLKRVPSRQQWFHLRSSYIFKKEEYDSFLAEIADISSLQAMRFLSYQIVGNCHLLAHQELLRVIMELVLGWDYGWSKEQVREKYRDIILGAYGRQWRYVANMPLPESKGLKTIQRKHLDASKAADWFQVIDPRNAVRESYLEALASALIVGDSSMFGFLLPKSLKSQPRPSPTGLPLRYVDLASSIFSETLLLTQRRAFFLKYERIRPWGFHVLEDSEHKHAKLVLKDFVEDDKAVSNVSVKASGLQTASLASTVTRAASSMQPKKELTLWEKGLKKQKKWRDYMTLGDEYLQSAVDAPSNHDRYFVLLGMLLLNQTEKLVEFCQNFDDKTRSELRGLSNEWKGFTFIDALIYGHLGSHEQEAIVVKASVFECLYELQYGKDLCDWRRYATAPLLAARHHSHVMLELDTPNGQWTGKLILYILFTFNQLRWVTGQVGQKVLYHVRNALPEAFAGVDCPTIRPHPSAASSLTCDEAKYIKELYCDDVLAALTSSVDWIPGGHFLSTVHDLASKSSWYQGDAKKERELFDRMAKDLNPPHPGVETLIKAQTQSVKFKSLHHIIDLLIGPARSLRKQDFKELFDVVKTTLTEVMRGYKLTYADLRFTGLLSLPDKPKDGFVKDPVSAIFEALVQPLREVKGMEPGLVTKDYEYYMSRLTIAEYACPSDYAQLVKDFKTKLAESVYKLYYDNGNVLAATMGALSGDNIERQAWAEASRKFNVFFGWFHVPEGYISHRQLLRHFRRLRIKKQFDALMKQVLEASGDIGPILDRFNISELEHLKDCFNPKEDNILAKLNNNINNYLQASTEEERRRAVHKYVIERVLRHLLSPLSRIASGYDDEGLPSLDESIINWRAFVEKNYYSDPYGILEATGFKNLKSKEEYYIAYFRYLVKKYLPGYVIPDLPQTDRIEWLRKLMRQVIWVAVPDKEETSRLLSEITDAFSLAYPEKQASQNKNISLPRLDLWYQTLRFHKPKELVDVEAKDFFVQELDKAGGELDRHPMWAIPSSSHDAFITVPVAEKDPNFEMHLRIVYQRDASQQIVAHPTFTVDSKQIKSSVSFVHLVGSHFKPELPPHDEL